MKKDVQKYSASKVILIKGITLSMNE